MATLAMDVPRGGVDWRRMAPHACAAVAFAALFWTPMSTLARDWWTDPDASHGLLLAPLALYLAWKEGISPGARPAPAAGAVMLLGAVVLRYLSEVAAELFTMRAALLGAAGGLVVFWLGARQLLRWWLPATLLLLSVPLPDVVLNTLALPLQFQASRLGAWMLEWRHVPVLLAGNVIHLPGQSLFVTEACSGLRSLSALLALGVLIGGLWFRSPASRALLVLLALPVAMLLNGVRIFLTGFAVFYIDPALGEGLIHLTEGWVIFVLAFLILGAVAWVIAQAEHALMRAG